MIEVLMTKVLLGIAGILFLPVTAVLLDIVNHIIHEKRKETIDYIFGALCLSLSITTVLLTAILWWLMMFG